MIDLRHLRHLVALADERHFARAAAQVHLSQPAFSRSIQAVERSVGLRLFERDSAGVRPTQAGDLMIERARRLLFDARCLGRDVDLYRDSQLGDMAFGVGPFPAATLMPRVLAELRARHPQVALRVHIDNWTLLLDRLRTEEIEFFVSDVRGVPEDAALQIQSVGRQNGHFYVRSGHPLAGTTCRLADVWRHGVAGTRLPQAVRAAFARLLGLPAGELPRLALECDDVALLTAVALSTDLVLATTDAAASARVALQELHEVTVRDLPALYSEMGVVSLRNRTPSPMAQRAIACIECVAKEVNV